MRILFRKLFWRIFILIRREIESLGREIEGLDRAVTELYNRTDSIIYCERCFHLILRKHAVLGVVKMEKAYVCKECAAAEIMLRLSSSKKRTTHKTKGKVQ